MIPGSWLCGHAIGGTAQNSLRTPTPGGTAWLGVIDRPVKERGGGGEPGAEFWLEKDPQLDWGPGRRASPGRGNVPKVSGARKGKELCLEP